MLYFSHLLYIVTVSQAPYYNFTFGIKSLSHIYLTLYCVCLRVWPLSEGACLKVLASIMDSADPTRITIAEQGALLASREQSIQCPLARVSVLGESQAQLQAAVQGPSRCTVPIHNVHLDWAGLRVLIWRPFCHANCLTSACPTDPTVSSNPQEDPPDLSLVPQE